MHIGGDNKVDASLHWLSAALAHRLQQVHPTQEPQGSNILNDVNTKYFVGIAVRRQRRNTVKTA